MVILGIAGASIIGMAVGAVAASRGTAAAGNTHSVTASTVTETITATGTVTRTVVNTSTVTATVTPPPVTVSADPTTNAPARTGPLTEFGDGTYLVGTDVAAGSYKSSGPRPGDLGSCYWARLKDDSGSNIIANDITEGPARFTAKTGEFLQIAGCDFTKV